MKIICSICGRGGSLEVKNKNLKYFLGKPLISYTVNQAKKSKIFDKIVLSSDSKKILNFGRKLKLDLVIKRPKKLSSPFAPKLKAIKHLFKFSEKFFETNFDIIVDLDITSPLRSIKDIKNSINKLKKVNKPSNLILLSKSRRSPYFNMVKIKKNKVEIAINKKNFNARQEVPKIFDVNPSVIVWNRKGILNQSKIINKNTLFNIVPINRSFDIDSELDFKLAEFQYRLLKRR